MKPILSSDHKSASAPALEPRICGYCANRFRDVHEPCAAEGFFGHFVPDVVGSWEDLPDPTPYSEILNLPAHVVRALYYRDIWYLVHKIRAMDGYFE